MSLDAIGDRLRRLRLTYNMNQASFCRFTGIASNAWNQYERAKSRLELDKAMIIVEKTGATLDWIYRGNPAGLPLQLAVKLGVAAA